MSNNKHPMHNNMIKLRVTITYSGAACKFNDILTVKSLGWICRAAAAVLLYFCNENIHSMVHCESKMMILGSLINCSGKAAQTSNKPNVKGPGSKVNERDSALGTLMTHAQLKETACLVGSAIQGTLM